MKKNCSSFVGEPLCDRSSSTSTISSSSTCEKEMKMMSEGSCLNLSKNNRLPALLRLYIYGLHGYFIEVTFTALWDFALTRDWRLSGTSSIWCLAIYGIAGFCFEKLSKYLRAYKIPIWARGFLYLLSIYFWEFSTGALLSYFGACPWDYSEFSYNIGGLITLEYAPFWIGASLFTERIVFGRLEQLKWFPSNSSSQNGQDNCNYNYNYNRHENEEIKKIKNPKLLLDDVMNGPPLQEQLHHEMNGQQIKIK